MPLVLKLPLVLMLLVRLSTTSAQRSWLKSMPVSLRLAPMQIRKMQQHALRLKAMSPPRLQLLHPVLLS
jgi:hypothetical protein